MKKFILFTILIFTIFNGLAQNNNKKDDGIKLLTEAKQLLKSNKKEDLDLAQQKLETIIYDLRKSKAMEKALYTLGTFHLSNDNDIDGQLYLKKMLKNFPQSDKAYDANYLLFQSYKKVHNNFQKNIYLKKLYQMNPDGKYTKNIIGNLIKLAVKEGNYKIGLDYINKALSLGKDTYEKDPAAFFAVGEIYYKSKNYNKAIIIFERMLNIFSHDPISFLGKERLAECYEEKNNYDTALKLYKDVFINNKETDAYALSTIKMTYLLINKNVSKITFDGNPFLPENFLEEIIKNKTKYSKSILPIAMQAVADFTYYNNNVEKSLILLKNLILKYPSSSFTELNKENFYKRLRKYVKENFQNKKYTKVINICEKTKNLLHNEYEILKYLGDSYQAMGASLKAEQIYTKLIKNSGKKSLVKNSLFQQAEIDYNLKNYQEAGREYQLFVENFSKSYEYDKSIARIIEILTILKKYQQAINYFEKHKVHLTKNELKEIAFYNVAKSYTKLSKPNFEKGRYYFNEYIKLNPKNKNQLFNAKLFIISRDIFENKDKNTIKKLNELLKLKEDTFVRFLKVEQFLKSENLKMAENELTKFKEKDYWFLIATDYIDTFKKTGTLLTFEKIGKKIFKTPFDL